MSARRGPEGVGSRLDRLLLVLPWLYERGRVPVDEAAARFDVTPEQMVRDIERISLCGVPPYLDEMIDVFIDDGYIEVGVPRLFTRPLRLTAEEGFSLQVAGTTAMALPGADPLGPLARALRKLEAVLGRPVVSVEVPRPRFLDRVQAAAAEGEVLELAYWSASSGGRRHLRVTPRYVAADRGNWYLRAVLDDGSPRWLRVDRIEEVTAPGERVEPWTGPAEPPDWDDEFAGAVLATLRVAAGGTWVAERYPVAATRPLPDGGLEVDLPVTSQRWLARLVLRLGPDVEVIAPAELTDLPARSATQVLRRYR